MACCRERARPGLRRRRRNGGRVVHQAPQPLEETPGALDTFLGPDHVAFGRRIREHEPPRRIGTERTDDVVGIDGVALRLRHLLDGADLDRRPCRDQRRLAGLPDLLDLHLGRRGPGAVGGAVGLVDHHALGEQAGERLVDAGVTGRLHGAGEEAAVEQVQNGMLDAADILVDRQPRVDRLAVGRRRRDPGIGEAGEIPGRIRRRCPWCRFRAGRGRRNAGRPRASRSDDGPADCRVGRTSRRPAISPASPFPAPGQCRISCNARSGSGNPNSAAATRPSLAGEN